MSITPIAINPKDTFAYPMYNWAQHNLQSASCQVGTTSPIPLSNEVSPMLNNPQIETQWITCISCALSSTTPTKHKWSMSIIPTKTYTSSSTIFNETSNTTLLLLELPTCHSLSRTKPWIQAWKYLHRSENNVVCRSSCSWRYTYVFSTHTWNNSHVALWRTQTYQHTSNHWSDTPMPPKWSSNISKHFTHFLKRFWMAYVAGITLLKLCCCGPIDWKNIAEKEGALLAASLSPCLPKPNMPLQHTGFWILCSV